MWFGDYTGERVLIMPSEEAIFVWPRVYFQASTDTRINQTTYDAGVIHLIQLSLNSSYSMTFRQVAEPQEYSWTFNFYTGEEGEYDARAETVRYDEFLEEVFNRGIVVLGFGIAALFTGVTVKRIKYRGAPLDIES